MPMLAAIAHATSTLVLVGLIWTIQVVHYPLFVHVDAEVFSVFEAAHSRRITAVIAVPWAVQGLSTAALLLAPPSGVPRWLVLTTAVLALIPVVVTVGWSVPAHTALADGFDAAAHARLVATTWWRTAAFTLGGVSATAVLVLALRVRPG